MEKIDFFRGEYDWLSNFYYSPVTINDKRYNTNEHFFQACKATIKSDHELIRKAKTPAIAKRLGRQILIREDWNKIRDEIMLKGVKEKFFQHIDLAQKLIETKNAILIEGNYWKDEYWGVYNGNGKNKLGEILMYVRSLLKNKIC